jgi:hypothetical protein
MLAGPSGAPGRPTHPPRACAPQQIAARGSAALYNNVTAAALAAEVQAAGGIITAADILGAAPQLQRPLLVDLGPYTLVLPPPPSSAAVVRAPGAAGRAEGGARLCVLLPPELLLAARARGWA